MFLIIISISFFLLVIWKIIFYICYRISTSDRYVDYVPMSWRMIKDIYAVNPNKWDYSIKGGYECKMNALFYNDTPIMLSFFGYQALRFYYYLECIGIYNRKHNLALEKILKEVKKDIENQRGEE